MFGIFSQKRDESSNYCPHCGTMYVCDDAKYCIECWDLREHNLPIPGTEIEDPSLTPVQMVVGASLAWALPIVTAALIAAMVLV